MEKREIKDLLRGNSPRISLVANTDQGTRSKAWERFYLIKCDEEIQPFAACKDCQAVYAYTKRDGTSALVSHSCGQLKKASQRQTTITSFAKPQPPTARVTEAKRRMSEKSARCCARDMRSYMFVEGAGMLDLAQALLDIGGDAAECGHRLTAQQVLPSAVTVSREVHRQAELARQEIRTRLKEEMSTCAVTTDGWVDPNRHVSYNCVTVHYLDNQFQLQSVVLATRMMELAHTGSNIFDEVSSVLEEFVPDWREEERVAAFVTDNAANVRSAFRDCLEPWTWFGCACHNLNLVVKHALDSKELNKDGVLKTLADQIATVKSVVTMVRRRGLDRHLERSLKMEVETRWNSMLAMVRSVVDAISQMTTLPAFQTPVVAELVSSLNATMLQRLVNVLTPLEEASEHLSGQLYPTIHLVAPTKEKLKRHLKVAAADDPTTKRLKERLSTALEAKFTVNSSHLMAAQLWPPHRRLPNFSHTVSGEQRAKAASDLVQQAMHVSCSTGAAQETTRPAPAVVTEASSSGSLPFFSFADSDKEVESRTSDRPRSEAREVADYFEDPGPVGKHIANDILGFWSSEATRARFPALCRVARRFLAVPAASTASERAFSVSGRILEERRSSLHPDSVDALVFLNSYERHQRREQQ